MSDQEDDKPTVVLDLNSLREEAKSEQDQLDDVASEIEFAAAVDDSEQEESQSPEQPLSVVLFDFQSDFFSKNVGSFPSPYQYSVVDNLKELNTHLQSQKDQVVVFNYNAAPKAVNQLCAQIKTKFPKIGTVIMAKNLSEEKAQQHQNTKSGAKAYVSAPFKVETLKAAIQKAGNL
ncbi:MAG: hypothetical protein CME64_12960 [Halobacteriovoraceae bacterium]|nr:hypothetical protein [Halobacteriovoraceae bacterium]|tara:strand:+ start:102892 stop:103419 length:528 start_codon:yes stop_codon:yes gene_type:complete